ncbi:MAG: transposase [Dehalococcoidia bacterium]|nr:transposase [Dehalococcoidia bacterium]
MKRIRLAPEAYRLGHAFSVTITTANRAGLFARADAADLCLELPQASVAKHNAALFAYCLMPDHLHMLVALPEAESLVAFVKHVKQTTSYHLQRLLGHDTNAWQASFYDHALRGEEALPDVEEYIFSNPVRAGLVAQASDYPYSGSRDWTNVLLSGPKGSDLQRTLSGSEGSDLQRSTKGSDLRRSMP